MNERIDSLLPARPELLQARLRLLPYLKSVHVDHANGFLSKYNQDLQSVTDEQFRELIQKEDATPSIIEFDSSIRHEGPILHSAYFTLYWSGVWGDAEQGTGEMDAITSNAKLLDVQFSKELHDGGLIYLCNDMPPVALHAKDIDYVSRRTGLDESSFRMIEAVEQNFGPEAIEHLSDVTCGKLISALEITPRHHYYS